ncbi:MAG: DUF4433 domain-containing protein [Desulfovibrio sp.]|jgi:hypothetical protein|nr:DUF4433 domain-containing protein [Desulfovibrio sp.]
MASLPPLQKRRDNTDEYPDRMEMRMAEFLVWGSVRWVDFCGVVVYDESGTSSLAPLFRGTDKISMKVRRDWYF